MIVAGIDLSLCSLGLVAVPADWDLQWSKLATETVRLPIRADASIDEQTERLRHLTERVAAFVRRHGVTHPWIEAYPASGGRAVPNLHRLAELGGAVRVELLRMGLVARFAPLASARKLVLGKLPRREMKAAVFEALYSYGARFGTHDEADAFVTANYGMHELEIPCLYRGA